jgi:hypothetical protein
MVCFCPPGRLLQHEPYSIRIEKQWLVLPETSRSTANIGQKGLADMVRCKLLSELLPISKGDMHVRANMSQSVGQKYSSA